MSYWLSKSRFAKLSLFDVPLLTQGISLPLKSFLLYWLYWNLLLQFHKYFNVDGSPCLNDVKPRLPHLISIHFILFDSFRHVLSAYFHLDLSYVPLIFSYFSRNFQVIHGNPRCFPIFPMFRGRFLHPWGPRCGGRALLLRGHGARRYGLDCRAWEARSMAWKSMGIGMWLSHYLSWYIYIMIYIMMDLLWEWCIMSYYYGFIMGIYTGWWFGTWICYGGWIMG